MLFNITKSPDPYIMRAIDLEIAAVAVAAIGHGHNGVEQIGGDRSAVVPAFATGEGGHEVNAWFTKHFGRDFNATLNHVATKRQEELCKALASVFLGTPAEKINFDGLAVQAPDTATYVNWQLTRHDAVRTSDNDIGRRAWTLASGIVQAELAKDAAVEQAVEEAAGATKQ